MQRRHCSALGFLWEPQEKVSHFSVLVVYSVRGRGWLDLHEPLTASSAILAIIGKKREEKRWLL